MGSFVLRVKDDPKCYLSLGVKRSLIIVHVWLQIIRRTEEYLCLLLVILASEMKSINRHEKSHRQKQGPKELQYKQTVLDCTAAVRFYRV